MIQLRIPAVYMRGGTSKGVFFHPSVLPADATVRDALLLRIVGSPDPYGQHIDGMGGGTSSTSKVVLVAKSSRPDCDVDYWFGHPSGTLEVGAETGQRDGAWLVTRAIMSRSARRPMEGWVRVPPAAPIGSRPAR